MEGNIMMYYFIKKFSTAKIMLLILALVFAVTTNQIYIGNAHAINIVNSTSTNLASRTGIVGKFAGGIVEGVSVVGSKLVSAGDIVLTKLNATDSRITTAMNASTTGLVGTMGKVVGFGSRIVLGAAKVALKIPTLAVKAGIYLTAVSSVGTVKLLGSSLGSLQTVSSNTSGNLTTLNTKLTHLYDYTKNLTNNGAPTTNGASTTNLYQYMENVDDTIRYTGTLQQNLTTSQGVVNNIYTGAKSTMNSFSITTKLAGLSLVEIGAKLAYSTASLVAGSAGETSLALAKTIQNLENTKTNLKLLKEMNKTGVINPYVYQQYILLSQQQTTQSQTFLDKVNKSITDSFLKTLTNINLSRNYINQNSSTITNQMNQYSNGANLYQKQISYSALSQYNNGLSNLNNSYSTTGRLQTDFNQATAERTIEASQSSAASLNEGALAERKPNTGIAESNNTAAQTPEAKKANEKYLAAYNKYISILNKDSESGDSQSLDASAALEEYKTAYTEYEAIVNKTSSSNK